MPLVDVISYDEVTLETARRLLESSGYTVIKTKSYRRAQERQRVAEALKEYADECRRGTERWVHEDLVPEIRRLQDRVTFLYGLAKAKGATDQELSGEPVRDCDLC